MIFNSLEYLAFLPLVFFVYWTVLKGNLSGQNAFLLIASYLFYGLWNWKFLFLLAFSTGLDFYSGIKIFNTIDKRRKRFWLVLSVFINLGLLAFFKYFNFFAEMASDLSQILNISYLTVDRLSIVLPVGISFYTFHGLSYVFDIYNGKFSARTNFIDYALFVSFFPLLVAGPIERGTHLLPQIESQRTFSAANSVKGLRQILWGLIKKVVIADNCATFANIIFDHPETYNSTTLILGAVLFAFQIYGDFSGYSDIALGSAKLLGFDLLKNFSYPYFSRNFAEFWKRWHISLSSWFRDYLYIPMGGNRTSSYRQVINVLVVFVVSGFWHGANWTFILWGFVNAIFVLCDNYVFKTNYTEIVAKGKRYPGFAELLKMLLTFIITCFIWVFFRCNSIKDAFAYLKGVFSRNLFSMPQIAPTILLLLIIGFVLMEWLGRESDFALENVLGIQHKAVRWSVYIGLVLCIVVFGAKPQTFIYFQF